MTNTSTPITRTKRLKSATTSDHDSVDSLVIGSRPFEDRERYAQFLLLQHRFHGALANIYQDAELNQLFPGLLDLWRIEAVEADLRDLGTPVPQRPQAVAVSDASAALGWLYCSEGSNLGAAILFKAAGELELDASFGARHLAAHPDGRALHWRSFVQQLDALPLDDSQEQQAVDGARAAFQLYRQAHQQVFGEAA
ncbi:MAG: hypothetical protein GAK43_01330 [Stenotrophomonas maltophilia]|nr:MAG: hypothetical protein GAK43_01330 [Stenotrophomonas maltophilia]